MNYRPGSDVQPVAPKTGPEGEVMPNRLSTLPSLPPRRVLLLPIVALVLMAGCSSSKSTVGASGGGATTAAPPANAPVKTMSTPLGTVVVDSATSMTLYHFDKDTP